MLTPKGFIQFHVMKAMLEQRGLNSQEIRKIAKEIIRGEGTFDPIEDRGWYSSAFAGTMPEKGSYTARAYGEGWIKRLCNRVYNHTTGEYEYHLNGPGREKFRELTKKFVGKKLRDFSEVANDDAPQYKVTPENTPVGVTPIDVFVWELYNNAKEERLTELKQAITYYVMNDLSIPNEWIEEYNDLLE